MYKCCAGVVNWCFLTCATLEEHLNNTDTSLKRLCYTIINYINFMILWCTLDGPYAMHISENSTNISHLQKTQRCKTVCSKYINEAPELFFGLFCSCFENIYAGAVLLFSCVLLVKFFDRIFRNPQHQRVLPVDYCRFRFNDSRFSTVLRYFWGCF